MDNNQLTVRKLMDILAECLPEARIFCASGEQSKQNITYTRTGRTTIRYVIALNEDSIRRSTVVEAYDNKVLIGFEKEEDND